MRQSILTQYDPRRGTSIATLAYEYPRGFRVAPHAHGSHQLVYAIEGVMEISAGESTWLIPPHFAIWIPARTNHSIRMPGPVSMRTLYIRRGLGATMPAACTVYHVTPLLRELMVETVRIRELRLRDPLHCALRDLLLAHLATASPLPTHVTLPKDPRALFIARRLLRDPSERASLADLCRSAGASVRTMQRIFRREAGSDFDFWRRQVRLMKAVELLVSGNSVKEVSFALGYRQPAAFVQMFREVLGATPRAWSRALLK